MSDDRFISQKGDIDPQTGLPEFSDSEKDRMG